MTQSKSRQPVVPGSTGSYAVLPLRDIVVFPHMIVPLFVGREKSIHALEEAVRTDRHILLATQINASDDDPSTPMRSLKIGTLASVLQLLKLPDGTVKVLVEGAGRAKRHELHRQVGFLLRSRCARRSTDELGDPVEAEALARSVVSEFENYVKLNKKISPEVVSAVTQIDEPSKLADTVGSHLAVKIADKQAILEIPTVAERLERVLSLMESEISVLQVEKRIRTRVKRQMEKTQREYYLNEQMKAIQKELGDSEDGKDELAEIEEKIEKTKFSKEAREKAMAELKKLRQMSPMSAEATVVRNYLDWMLGIPWSKRSRIKKDLLGAQVMLDQRLGSPVERGLALALLENATGQHRGQREGDERGDHHRDRKRHAKLAKQTVRSVRRGTESATTLQSRRWWSTTPQRRFPGSPTGRRQSEACQPRSWRKCSRAPRWRRPPRSRSPAPDPAG